jgi:hypothetical protein
MLRNSAVFAEAKAKLYFSSLANYLYWKTRVNSV